MALSALPDWHPQDDLLLVAALSRYSVDFRHADPESAERARVLAVAIADQHGLDPADAVRQLEFDSTV